MLTRYPKLNAFYRYAIEFIFVIAVYFALQAWMSRDMTDGNLPGVKALDIRGSQPVNLPLNGDQAYLLHFWATWCPVCKWMESSVVSISEDYTVIGIALQSGSDQEILDFMQRHGIHYPTISDTDGSISHAFGVDAVPGSFIVDSNDRIRFSERGLSSEWGLRFRLWWSSI